MGLANEQIYSFMIIRLCNCEKAMPLTFSLIHMLIKILLLALPIKLTYFILISLPIIPQYIVVFSFAVFKS